MSRTTHMVLLALIGLGALAGAVLWSRVGVDVWLSDFIAWCG